MEKCYIDNNAHKSLHPCSLEGCVVRISDIIAYVGKDCQDLCKAKIASEEFTHKGILGTKNGEIISKLIVNIIYSNPDIDKPYYEIVQPMELLYNKLLLDLQNNNYDSVI